MIQRKRLVLNEQADEDRVDTPQERYLRYDIEKEANLE